ncbi:FkbM family methyltransferase [Rhizobium tibeticum]|uniref:FkbM family methyltransferase n=1 Tax=Rhizobium tibeticum TaxID=501024 RepID=UPI0014289976|nr:FkbM family methyltransferase [Rhizobium tibeticum]
MDYLAGGTSAGIAIDVGAHHGLFSRALLESGHFAKVVAFEANPQTYEKLNKTPPTQAGMETVNLALGDTDDELELYSDSDSATASLLPYLEGSQRGAVHSTRVSVKRLDNFLATRPDLSQIRLLKIDTQGNDLSVLRGATATLEVHRPIVQTEYIFLPLYVGQCTPKSIESFMKTIGYSLYSLGDIHISAQGQLAFCDAIFKPDETVMTSTPPYIRIDDNASYEAQIKILTQTCADRLSLINGLTNEVDALRSARSSLLQRIFSWVR